MQVQVNSDNSIEFGSIAANGAEGRVRERLARFADRLTRVEVHLRDVDGTDLATGQGLEAMLEARPSGSQPLTVLHRAQSSREAPIITNDVLYWLSQRDPVDPTRSRVLPAVSPFGDRTSAQEGLDPTAHMGSECRPSEGRHITETTCCDVRAS